MVIWDTYNMQWLEIYIVEAAIFDTGWSENLS
jgi:hypothetical protein